MGLQRTVAQASFHFMTGRSRVAQNPEQGDFGEQWLEAVAAGCDIIHGRPGTLDLEKADVELTLRGIHNGTYNPSVKVQVKTIDIAALRAKSESEYAYDLDLVTYDVLRREDHSTRRILAVIGVEAPGRRVRLHEEGTLLVGFGAWVSLEGAPASENRAQQVITLPLINTLDPSGLERMLTTYGVHRTTPVPDFNPWEAS